MTVPLAQSNVASLVCGVRLQITEVGIYHIVSCCGGIETLQLDGCETIKPSAIAGICEGLPHVELAVGFFGIQGRGDAIYKKFQTQERIIQHATAVRLQSLWRVRLARRAREARERVRAEKLAVLRIQRKARELLKRKIARIWRHNYRRRLAAVVIQVRL